MISVHFQGEPFSITVIQVCAPTSNDEEAKVEWFYEDFANKGLSSQGYGFSSSNMCMQYVSSNVGL